MGLWTPSLIPPWSEESSIYTVRDHQEAQAEFDETGDEEEQE